jgi:hypothetical protein
MLTVEYGIDSYLFGGQSDQPLDMFASESVPRVREQVARQRGKA